MTVSLARRHALRLVLLSGASLATACTVRSGGGTTSVTLDIARLVTDGRSILSALNGALSIPAVFMVLGTNLAIAQASLSAAQLALTEIEALAGNTLTVSIDTTRVQTLVVTLLSDAQSILALIQGVVPQLTASMPTATANDLASLVAAVVTLVPLVQLAAGLATALPGAAPLDESQARAIAARYAR